MRAGSTMKRTPRQREELSQVRHRDGEKDEVAARGTVKVRSEWRWDGGKYVCV